MSRPGQGVVAWRKSSYSGGSGGECVEMAAIRQHISSETPRIRVVLSLGSPMRRRVTW